MSKKGLAKVLIVDDLSTNIELLQVYLEEEGYTILTASNGKEAWEITQQDLPDIILLDVMMPVMDGYEACRLIKQNPTTENIPVVMVTSLNEVSSRITGIEAGADDFLSKPFNIYELLARVRSLIRIKQYNSQILDQNRVFEKELEIAKKVQEAILPADNELAFEGLTLHFRYIPNQKLGGDYFNVIQLPDKKIGIFMADVMGHGVAASLITMVLKTLFDNHVSLQKTPSDFLFTLNNELQKIFGEILIYATAIYIIVDQENRKLYYANGAHPPALLYNKTKPQISQLKCKGTILGIFKDAKYETIELSYQPNDQLFLYTDGLTDVENTHEEAFGDERLIQIVEDYKDLAPKELIETLLGKLYHFAHDESFEDDINVLCLRLDK